MRRVILSFFRDSNYDLSTRERFNDTIQIFKNEDDFVELHLDFHHDDSCTLFHFVEWTVPYCQCVSRRRSRRLNAGFP
jgi:hypothetical protein